jgi:hypothetical protein
MSPGDAILVLLGAAFAVLNLALQGFGLHGWGPAILALAGAIWNTSFQALRQQRGRRPLPDGFLPGTQHLALLAVAGWAALTLSAVAWALLALPRLPGA